MTMQNVQRIPAWATFIVMSLTGWLLVGHANRMEENIKSVREKLEMIAPAVAVHTSMFAGYEKTLADLQKRIERLEEHIK